MSYDEDIEEFLELVDSYKDEDDDVKTKAISLEQLIASPKSSDRKSESGQPVQYSMYRSGYTAATPTIKSLPAGCYDIKADSNCIYVTKTLDPAGLLLELPEMKSEEVIKVVDTFWNSEKDYKEGNEFVIGGATFKAGVMLYGPPGSGKSCTLKIVSKKLIERDGIVFYADNAPQYASDFLTSFTRIEKNRKCIVIFEDIDSLIQNYGESAYLEMLDSAKSINNVLFIATTNYPDRLDPRIYNRPGRFSHVIKIGLPTEKAREAYLKAVLKNHRDVEHIVKSTENFTIDHLSSLLNAVYREKKDLNSEIKRLKSLFKIPKIQDDRVGITLGKED